MPGRPGQDDPGVPPIRDASDRLGQLRELALTAHEHHGRKYTRRRWHILSAVADIDLRVPDAAAGALDAGAGATRTDPSEPGSFGLVPRACIPQTRSTS